MVTAFRMREQFSASLWLKDPLLGSQIQIGDTAFLLI